MITKPADIPYCGVDRSKIESAHPKFKEGSLELFHYYVTERLKIHLRKDIDRLPPPWTNNYYLNEYRFTQVRRENDKTTAWLINNISNNIELSYDDRIVLSILYRMFSRIETAEMLRMNDSASAYYLLHGDEDHVRELVHKSIPDDFRVCTNAFKTCGLKTGTHRIFRDESSMVMRFILTARMIRSNMIDELKICETQKDVYEMLKSIKGCGNFMAYQMFVDLTYIDEFPFSENEFVVSGPGCNYGLRFLFDDWDGCTDEELIFWMRYNIINEFNNAGMEFDSDELFRDLTEEERCLNVMSLENCMCEFSKFYVCTNVDKKHKKMPRHYIMNRG